MLYNSKNVNLISALLEVDGNLKITLFEGNYNKGGIKFSGHHLDDECSPVNIVLDKDQIEIINDCKGIEEVYNCYMELEIFNCE